MNKELSGFGTKALAVLFVGSILYHCWMYILGGIILYAVVKAWLQNRKTHHNHNHHHQRCHWRCYCNRKENRRN